MDKQHNLEGNDNTFGALILAAGQSSRMNGIDKTFAYILGKPLILHTLDVFLSCPSIQQIVLVLSESNIQYGRGLLQEGKIPTEVTLCIGGTRRQDSASKGLKVLGQHDWIVVHDGARPCLSLATLNNTLTKAQCYGNAVTALPVTDTLKKAGNHGYVSDTISRDSIWSIQTPQVFPYSILHQAYSKVKLDVTDDSSLVEALGYRIKLVEGSIDNLKVTSPRDLDIAEMILARREGYANN